ncbi:MAG TPA: hypothetical protein VFQ35_18695, partial [Polyangiaceae bacterium]|nr:hypothetical protein [Polyangiaceae bacterium]
ALEFVGAPRTPAFAELPVVLERQSVAGLLQLLLVPALLGAWWLLRGRKRVDDSEPPLRIPLPRPRARLDLLKPQLLIGLLAAVPLTFWLGAVGGRLRAAAAFKALDDQIAPPELVPALVPEAMQGTHGGNRPLFVSAQGIYTRKKTHIVRLEDARRLDGADCLQVLTGLDLNPDASAGTRREYFPSSVLLDRGADAHTLACSLLYVSLSPQQGDNYATKVGYGIAAAQFIDPMWQRFLVRNVVPNLPEEYAVFRHSWYEVGLVPTFLGTERYSNRRPPHVHLAKSGWRFRVDSDRDHPAREGTLVGTTDERLARLKEKLDVIYALHVSADTSVPAADVLRIAAAFRSVALYVGADVAAQLEPEREVREPYAGPRPEP